MKKQTYSISINASRNKVWDVLWGDKTYGKWTAAFGEGSRVITDWQEGSKVQFLGPEDTGMLSIIEQKKAPEIMNFRHIGIIKEGVEDTTGPEVREWAPSNENYLLTAKDDKTILTIQMDLDEKHVKMFNEMWAVALENVKNLAEAK
ncbi:MAG: ATPase [Cytophagaceae bacterium]|nr:ATPase [Cytophagaceae bacterium]|tara:strand:+ start:299 stop:739 length:441 start_codon:yes stop_codon:yes gene_type:complete